MISTALPLSWTHRVKLHQSTIHCIAKHVVDDENTLIITGGDDNAITMTRCSFEKSTEGTSTKETSTSVLTIPRAHAAAITALSIYQLSGQARRIWIITASLDQRLKVWQVEINLNEPGVEGFKVEKVQNSFTAVADVSSLAQFSEDGCDKILVSGVGMDVWSIDTSALSMTLENGKFE